MTQDRAVDLDGLERLARAASKGPWFQSGAPWFRDGCAILSGSDDPHVARFVADTARDDWSEHPGDRIFAEADAAYIAAANPSVVLALIERIRALEAALAREIDDDEAAARWTAARIDGGEG